MAVEVDVGGPMAARVAPNGNNLMPYQRADGASLNIWSPDNQTRLASGTISYDEYAKLRKDNPDLNLPDWQPPKIRQPGTNANGNTVGRVTGQSGGSGKPAAASNPPVKPETEGEGITSEQVLDGLQLGLDAVGLIPGVGEFADLANAGISALRGDFIGAGLSLAAAIPFAGWGATTAKVGRKGMHAVEESAEAAAKRGSKEAPPPKEHPKDPKEQPKKKDEEDGGKSEGKKKPDCGQVGVYKNKKDFDNTDTNWDHVPSGRALEQAAENKLKAMRGQGKKSMWDSLTAAQRKKVLNAARNEAYTINIPADVHKNSSLTWGSRNKPRYGPDAGNLREAMLRDMDALEEAMKNSDHPCRKQYSAARRAMQRIDPDKHLQDIINITIRGL